MIAFLDNFENYCQTRYPGCDNSLVGALGDYLEGEAREVYKTSRRNINDYQVLRGQLLRWERDRLQGREKEEFEELDEAVPLPEENVEVFAARLWTLACYSFPNTDVGGNQTLRARFMSALPPQVQSHIEQHEEMRQEMYGEDLPWSRLVSLAAKHTKHRPLVEVGSGNPSPPPQTTNPPKDPPLIDISHLSLGGNTGPAHARGIGASCPTCGCNQGSCNRMSTPSLPGWGSVPQEYYQQQRTGPQFNTIQQPLEYYPSGSRGRFRARNRGNRGAYPAITYGAPQERWPARSRGGPWTGTPGPRGPVGRGGSEYYPRPQPQKRNYCQYCGALDHDFVNCPARPQCFFCKKRGHLQKDCYAKKNQCVRCEEVGHVVENCPYRQKGWGPENPQCPFCRKPHLGRDCPKEVAKRSEN